RSIAKVVAADPGPLIREFDTSHRAPGALSATGLDELVTRSRAAERQRGQQRRSWAMLAGVVTARLALGAVAGFAVYHVLAGPRPAAQAGLAASGGHRVAQHGAGLGTAGPASPAGPAAASAAPTASHGPARASAPRTARALTPVSATAAGP